MTGDGAAAGPATDGPATDGPATERPPTERPHVDPAPPAGRDGVDMPGSAIAREHGCACSVLANTGYRRRRESAPVIDPTCRVHAL